MNAAQLAELRWHIDHQLISELRARFNVEIKTKEGMIDGGGLTPVLEGVEMTAAQFRILACELLGVLRCPACGRPVVEGRVESACSDPSCIFGSGGLASRFGQQSHSIRGPRAGPVILDEASTYPG